jgi:two-component system KDP operon response regulator KdpE
VTRVLVVDDDPAIGRALQRNLVARGYEVWVSESGTDALQAKDDHAPDLIILDLMLPDLSGIDVCRAIRRESAVPILVLSAKGEQQTKVQALDLGADDYLTKPFGMDELLARMRALLRRLPELPRERDEFVSGRLRMVMSKRQAWLDEAAIELTAREFDVLAYLMRNEGKVVTHRQLLAAVWGPEYFGETQYLRVFINRVRRKLEDDAAHPKYIVTDPGIGYRLVSPT